MHFLGGKKVLKIVRFIANVVEDQDIYIGQIHSECPPASLNWGPQRSSVRSIMVLRPRGLHSVQRYHSPSLMVCNFSVFQFFAASLMLKWFGTPKH